MVLRAALGELKAGPCAARLTKQLQEIRRWAPELTIGTMGVIGLPSLCLLGAPHTCNRHLQAQDPEELLVPPK